MKKIINFRPIFYGFLALGLGIYLARFIFSGNLFACIFTGLGLGLLLFFTIKHKKFIRLVSLLCVFAVGIGMFFLEQGRYASVKYESETNLVVGRVNAVYEGCINLGRVSVNGKNVGHNIKVVLYNAGELAVGNIIEFEAPLQNAPLFTFGSMNSYNYTYDLTHTANISLEDVTIISVGDLTLAEKFRQAIKGALDNNMDPASAGVSYASLFGDKSFVDGDIKESFKITGISHMLAVSGLHIGFIVSLLTFFLRKIKKLKGWHKLIIIFAILFFYCYLCSFSNSVVRASLMFLILGLANIFGRTYDRLNALSVAGIILLLIRPLAVFDVSFLLSFGSVFCIFMFMPMFKRLFGKLKKCPKFLSDSLSIMLSAQLGLLPMVIRYYGFSSILSVLANLICVPIFEIFFILIFILSPLVALMPFLGFMLKIPALIISGIIYISKFLAEAKFAIVNFVGISAITMIIIYITMFAFSHFVKARKRIKFPSVLAMLLVGVTFTFVAHTPTNNNFSITNLKSYENTTYALEFAGEIYCVGNFDGYTLKHTLNYLQTSKFKASKYCFNYNEQLLLENQLGENCTFAPIEDDTNFAYNTPYTIGNTTVTCMYLNGEVVGYHFEHHEYSVGVFNPNANINQINLLVDYYQIKYVVSENNDISDFSQQAVFILNNGNFLTQNDNTSKKLSGNFTISINNDNISSIRSLD
ncbi:MAG: ComEC/Rec2 family competence protein [Clostridiales bacterium]|nr:ComEC/Rec2 family competence protein [Clostridiales bacterium]